MDGTNEAEEEDRLKDDGPTEAGVGYRRARKEARSSPAERAETACSSTAMDIWPKLLTRSTVMFDH